MSEEKQNNPSEEAVASEETVAAPEDVETADLDETIEIEIPTDDAPEAEEDPVAALEAKIAALEEEKKALYDQALRSKADFENFRRRSEREKNDHIRYANKELFIELLAVRDNFERAMTAVNEENEKDPFVVGVKMIQKQLEDVFSQNGVEVLNPKGEAFNPHLHEALANEETSEFEDNTVMEVFQKGFRYKGMLLRPAQVKVASAADKEPIDTEV